MPLDKKDQKILAELSENALISRYKLAKIVGASREVVDYRIKRLERLGVIKAYQARVDLSNFVYGVYMVMLRLKKFNAEIEKDIVSKLKSVKYTHWLSKTIGEYDLVLTFSTTHASQLEESLTKILQICGEHLLTHKVLVLTKELKDTYQTIFTSNVKPRKSITKELTLAKLDKIDQKILQVLAKKADRANKEIAKEVKLTPEAVRIRVKNLEKRKIILNYRTMIDPLKIQKRFFFVFMDLKCNNAKEKRKIENYLKSHSQVTFSSNAVGEFSSVNVIYEDSLDELRDTLLGIRNSLSEFLEKFSILTIAEINQHTYYPQGFFA